MGIKDTLFEIAQMEARIAEIDKRLGNEVKDDDIIELKDVV